MLLMAINWFSAVDRLRNLVVTDGGTISSDNGNFATDGNGNLTTGAIFFFQTTGTAQSVTTGGTISLAPGVTIQRLTTAGAVTGVIMPAGTANGQHVMLFNTSGNTITFAAAGTSRVADGASAVIAANTMKTFAWDGVGNLWYHN